MSTLVGLLKVINEKKRVEDMTGAELEAAMDKNKESTDAKDYEKVASSEEESATPKLTSLTSQYLKVSMTSSGLEDAPKNIEFDTQLAMSTAPTHTEGMVNLKPDGKNFTIGEDTTIVTTIATIKDFKVQLIDDGILTKNDKFAYKISGSDTKYMGSGATPAPGCSNLEALVSKINDDKLITFTNKSATKKNIDNSDAFKLKLKLEIVGL